MATQAELKTETRLSSAASDMFNALLAALNSELAGAEFPTEQVEAAIAKARAVTEPLPTDLITGLPVEPWAMHFLSKGDDVRERVARALSVPQHHTTWDMLSDAEKDLFYMQADYAITAMRAASA